MAEAVFQGTYSDWKLIKTRSVVQIVIEVPLEQAPHVYTVLGGMPQPGSELPVAVARLAPQVTEPKPEAPAERATSRKKQTPSQRAHWLCQDKGFWKWLETEYETAVSDSSYAADCMRGICNVGSRAEFDIDGSEAQRTYLKLESDFNTWAGRT